MDIIKGIPVSPGVKVGKVFVLERDHRRIPRRQISPDHVAAEVQRLDHAFEASVNELKRVHSQARDQMGADAAKIFLFHIGMLEDAALVNPIRALIADEYVSAEFAVGSVFGEWADRFAAMGDSAFTTKVNDIDDLAERVQAQLGEERRDMLAKVDHDTIVVARDLTPSQTADFDRRRILGVATDLGGKTSHTAIIANALHLPAVVGCSDLTSRASDGSTIIVDGDRGTVILDPDDETLDRYRGYAEQAEIYKLSLSEIAGLPAVTLDGTEIHLLGNIEFPEMIDELLDLGSEGIGLYRTEFLYLTRPTEPTEEDHFKAYTACLDRLGPDRPLVIRTLDLGADKYTQARTEIPERNPFLGCRSIRLSLRSIGTFKIQLRAILRASALGDVRVMFPLITSTGEYRHAKLLIRDVMEDLAEEGRDFDPDLMVGMMVEVPAAAIMASTFAKEVDFFSIGTNDLVQYTLAVDRTNERVAHLYNPAHPAVIRLIREVIKGARRQEIPVSCCGESAGDPEFALLLLGLGLRTLSVNASSVPVLKRLIRSVRISQCERVAKKAIAFDSENLVAAYLRDQARQIVPEAFDGRAVED